MFYNLIFILVLALLCVANCDRVRLPDTTCLDSKVSLLGVEDTTCLDSKVSLSGVEDTTCLEPRSGRVAKSSLLVVDPQNDFYFYSLKVPGADHDLGRSIKFVKLIDPSISNIFVTLDTHSEDHLAHDASLLTYPDGSDLPVFTTVTADDIESGKVLVRTGMEKIFLKYLKDLEQGGKYQYTKWPPHCVKGTNGHLVPIELRNEFDTWSSKTGKEVQYIEKGSNDMTEMYSALSAEVPQENDSSTQLNTDLINSLNENDYVIVFGQAKSHCVKATVEDYLDHIGPNTKIILLKDLTSSVPGFDHLGTELEETLIRNGHIVSTSDEVSLLLH